jgi:hypothetical protein
MIGYEGEQIGQVETAHELLKAVYRSPLIPLAVRMRAAMAAISFESPKLGVSVLINDADIAVRLDKAIARMNAATAKAIDGSASVIEAQPAPEPLPADAPSPNPLARIYNTKLYRRRF